jgi:hypothetical protein
MPRVGDAVAEVEDVVLTSLLTTELDPVVDTLLDDVKLENELDVE